MWDYVFSPRLMMIDAIAGLIAWIAFRVVRGRNPTTMLEWLVVAGITLVLRHAAPTGARAMPAGYVGQMGQMCLHEASRDDCLCAIDALEQQIGHSALVGLAVRMQMDLKLPPDFENALAGCRG
jgi:hypothetical protein